MKQLTLFFFSFFTLSVYAQSYPFARDFVNGSVIFKDSVQKTGQVKWFPHQNEKLHFRETEKGETVKYSPEDIAGFRADTLKFIALKNFEAYSDNYALLGKPSKIKHTFAQVLHTGRFNIYFVLVTGYNAFSGAIQTYPNFLFQNTLGDSSGLVAYPYAIRMKDKKYEKAKENLYLLFKDYPALVEKIKNYRQQDDFFDIINSVKAVNPE